MLDYFYGVRNFQKRFLKNVVIGTHFNAHPNWPLGRGIARIKDLDNHFQNKLKNPFMVVPIFCHLQKDLSNKKILRIYLLECKKNTI